MPPSMETDFEGWNASIEVNNARLYDPKRPIPTAFAEGLSSEHELAMLQTMDSLRASSAVIKRDIFLLQRDITRWVVERVAEDPAEARWAALNEAARRKLLLAALKETCEVSSDMPPRRNYVPEVVIGALAQGDAFMRLLNSACFDEMLPKDQQHGDYVRVENVSTKSPALKDYLIADMHDERHTFLFLFLWTSLLALYGRSQTYVPTRPTSGAASKSVDSRKLLAQSGMSEKEIDQQLKGWRKEMDAAGHACSSCNTVDRALPAGKKMQKCGRCLPAIALWCCDRTCQTNDWKRHKKTCGQSVASHTPRTFVDSTPAPKKAAKSDEAAGIPAAAPGFKRSPALLAQIEALKQQPDLDYVLFLPDPAPANGGAKFANAMGSIFFIVCRNRAMTNGDPQAVTMMYKQLVDSAMQPAVGFVLGAEGLKKQLSKEYGVNIDAELKRQEDRAAADARANEKDLKERLLAKVKAHQPVASRNLARKLSEEVTDIILSKGALHAERMLKDDGALDREIEVALDTYEDWLRTTRIV